MATPAAAAARRSSRMHAEDPAWAVRRSWGSGRPRRRRRRCPLRHSGRRSRAQAARPRDVPPPPRRDGTEGAASDDDEDLLGADFGVAAAGPAAPGDGAHVTFEARGRTSRTADEVDEWFAASPYAADNYDLWSRNCNHFADALLAFLGVAPLPAMVTEVPAKVLASPMGAMLRPTIDKAVAVLRDSSDGGDGSMVDRFLETVVEQPGGLLVAPIVKMMRSIAA